MARFYGTLQGNRGEASRMGTPNSGLSGHIRGWRVGARVELSADGECDIVRVDGTRGSSGSGATFPLAEIIQGPTGELTVIPYGRDGKAGKSFKV